MGKSEENGGEKGRKWGKMGGEVKVDGKWEKVRGKCGGKGKEKGKVEEKWRKE